MKWVIALILILIIGCAGFFYFSKQKQERQIKLVAESCMTYGNQNAAYVDAIKAQDESRCDALEPEMMQKRCHAVVRTDASLCLETDRDCKAIAGNDLLLCTEPICEALVTKDLSYCDEIGDSEWCRMLVNMDTSAFEPDSENCRQLAVDSLKEQT